MLFSTISSASCLLCASTSKRPLNEILALILNFFRAISDFVFMPEHSGDRHTLVRELYIFSFLLLYFPLLYYVISCYKVVMLGL